jgi:beta-glucanase (GH16 family)
MSDLKVSRRAVVTAALTGVIGAGLSACSSAEGSVLTFEDDFNGAEGSGPDPAKWHHDVGSKGYGYQQLQSYTTSRSNSFIDGEGHLVIRATRDEDGYQSARLTTLSRFAQYRGTFESRIKLQVEGGAWPAFWLLGLGQWPSHGEVDIVENYGQEFGESSVHTPNGTDNVFTAAGRVPLDSDWHVWRTVWDAHGFSFARDGVPYLKVKSSELRNWPFASGRPMYLILNLAVGGAAGVPPASTRFPVEMQIDYVRVWK